MAAPDRQYGQYRDFDRVQTARWNKLQCSQEQRNLLNYDIILEDITLCTGGNSGRVLLNGANLQLMRGRKYGLIGRNGVGKTTLLRHIADHKIMGIFDHMRCVYVDDGARVAIEDPALSCVAFMLEMHKERIKACAELAALLEGADEVDPDVLAHVVDKLTLLRSDEAEARARKVLRGLSLDAERPIAELSGGQRHVAALATALFIEADVLLLDEPTNHVSIEGVIWLEEFLRTCKSTVVAVSHDQDFLNNFTTDIINFESCTLRAYKGNYENFVNTRALQLQHQASLYVAQEIRRKRMERTIANLQARASRCGANVGGTIHSRQMTLKHRLGASLDNVHWKYGLMGPRPEILAPPNEESFRFELPTDVSDVPEASGDGETLLMRLRDVAVGYDPKGLDPVISGVSIDITLSTRLALIGKNGTGKSTLIKCIAGDIDPCSGDVIRWGALRIGYFHQHAVKEILAVEVSPLVFVHQQHPSLSQQQCRDLLGGLGLLGEIAEATPVAALSDGQRARVLFAALMGSSPHIILLDEPTSHCDAETSAALAEALTEFQGAVIVASHDRCFVTEVASEIYCTDPGRRGPFSGDFAEYKRLVLAEMDAAAAGSRGPKKTASGTVVATTTKKAAASTPKAAGAAAAAATPAPAPPANFGHVVCRHCGEGHFSHSCPNRVVSPPAPTQDEAPKPQRPAGSAGKKVPAALPPLTEKAKDGKGDWKVAVPKSVMRRLKKGAA